MTGRIMCKSCLSLAASHTIVDNALLTTHPLCTPCHTLANRNSKRTVHTNETFDFLKDIVAKVPDPVETDTGATGTASAAGDNRGGKRRKTAKNAEESE